MKKALLIFYMLLCIDFYSCLPLEAAVNLPAILQLLSLLLFLFLFFTIANPKGSVLGSGVRLMVISMLMGIISSDVLYHQSYYDSIKAVMGLSCGMYLYFLCLRFDIEETFIVKALVIISIFYTTFEIVQQVTYPYFIFNGRPENELTGLLEQRMGLWRFYIFGVNYCMLAFLIVFERVINKQRLATNIWLMILLFLGIVFFLARKNIYGTISCVLFGLFFSRAKAGSLAPKVIVCLFIFLIAIILPSYMIDLNTQTSQELGDSDFIRFVSANYFINDFNDTTWYKCFGAGLGAGNSQLQKIIYDMQRTYNIYADDCGVVGYYSKFGLFGLFALLYTIFLILRNWRYVDLSLKLFIVLEIEICFFDFMLNCTRNVACLGIYFYLVECSIKRNKAAVMTAVTNENELSTL